MMSDSEHCCLCASDEGVFLDIFANAGDQRNFHKELQTCLQVKVHKNNALSTKICHKCAFELGDCNDFLYKYNQARKLVARYSESQLRACCCLCCATGKKGRLFELVKDLHLSNNPLQKLQECLNTEFTEKEAVNRLICLPCRYNLDLLFDLKNLSYETSAKLKRIFENKVIASELPKTETFIVNRKTTLARPSKLELHTPSDSDSDSSTMARGQSRSNKLSSSKSVKSSSRTCGECQSSIEDGQDMFRLHRTGVTVCKQCWITIDPLKNATSKRKRQSSLDGKNTKLCAVFLKDVLSNAAIKDNRAYKVEKDEKGNTMYIVTDESSENEDIPNKKVKISSNQFETNSVKSCEDTEVIRNLRPKRSVKGDSTDNEDRPNKKIKSGSKQSDSESVKSSGITKSPETLQGQRPKRVCRNQSTDSDVPSTKNKRDSSVESKGKSKLLSKAEIEFESETSKTRSGKRDGRTKNTGATKSHNEDSSSGEDGSRRRTRTFNEGQQALSPNVHKSESKVQRERPSRTSTSANESQPATSPNVQKIESKVQKERPLRTSTSANESQPATSPNVQKIESKVQRERPSRTSTRSISVSSKEPSPPPEKLDFKSPIQRNLRTPLNVKSLPTKNKTESPPKKPKDSKTGGNVPVEDKEPYMCTVCHTTFRNKLSGMTHELTHAKQIEIKLEKVRVMGEDQNLDDNLLKTELEEQSHDISSTSDASHVSDKGNESSVVKLSTSVVNEDTDLTHMRDSEPEKMQHSLLEEKSNTLENPDDPVDEVLPSGSVSETVENKDVLDELIAALPDVKQAPTLDDIEKSDAMEVSLEETDQETSKQERANLEMSSLEEKEGNDKGIEKIETLADRFTQDAIENDDNAKTDSVAKPDEIVKNYSPEVINSTAQPDPTGKDAKVQNAETDRPEKGVADETTDLVTMPHKVRKDVISEHDKAVELNKVEKDVVSEYGEAVKPENVEKDANEENIPTMEIESETDIRIVDTGSSEDSLENLVAIEGMNESFPEEDTSHEKVVEKDVVTSETNCHDRSSLETVCEEAPTLITKSDDVMNTSAKLGDIPKQVTFECLYESEPKTIENEQADSKQIVESTSVTAATEILKEVFDLATAEVQRRLHDPNSSSANGEADLPETLENISKEINNIVENSGKSTEKMDAINDATREAILNQISADMPSLDPISEADPTNDCQKISSDM